MNFDRRRFLKQFTAGVAGTLALPYFANAAKQGEIQEAIDSYANVPAKTLAQDEDFWYYIQQAYTSSPNIINLNNGGVSPQPTVVQEACDRYNRLANECPSYYMWGTLGDAREPMRKKLAKLAGVSPEEIAINRNTSEALDTIIMGLPLEKGDEVVLAKQDYPRMVNAWKAQERRNGVKLVWIDLPLPLEDDAEYVKYYTDAFTSKTKVIQITHIINWFGQIAPCRRIADAAHAKGIEVLIDGAHTFAHLEYKIPELGADYFGTSLHKWLCAPFGTGMSYVKKDLIKKVRPLFPEAEDDSEDIRKFEGLGTRNIANEVAIGQAIDFHLGIGSKRKEERLRYLKNYWAKQVKDLPNVTVRTSMMDEYSCGIALVDIDGIEPAEFRDFLFKKYKLHVISIKHEEITGVRVTPHVYTTLENLDLLVAAIKDLAENGLEKKEEVEDKK